MQILTRITRLVRHVIYDLRFGGRFLGGASDSRYADAGAHQVGNTEYEVLTYIFKDQIRPDDVLVDVGCGKGRVINWWLLQGYKNKIVGLELDELVAQPTRRRLRRYSNVSIITGDAVDNIPADATVLYLFNPFKVQIVERLKLQLETCFANRPGVRLFYYRPRGAMLFENDPRWRVEKINIPITAQADAIKITLLPTSDTNGRVSSLRT